MLPWAGYTRVSRVGDRGERLLSPQLQTDRIEGYAKARGLAVEMLQPELDVSGGKANRPILDAAIDAITHGTYAGIIVAQLDRLSRMGILDSLKLIRRIEDAGGKVIAVAENFDDSTPEGRMSRNVHMSIGNMQLERYGEAFARSKASAVERGVWPLPVVPIGYVKDTGTRRLVKGPEEAVRRVTRTFELRALGNSWAKIADILGGSPRTAAKIATNRVYLGELNYANTRNPEAHEPLVSRGLFESAQLGGVRPPRSTNPQPALLTGIVRCAHCQRNMSPGARKGEERIYRCFPRKAAGRCSTPAMISQGKLDSHVTALFLEALAGVHAAQPQTDTIEQAAGRLESAEAELAAYQQATSITDLGAEHFMAGMRTRVAAVNEARAELGTAHRAAGPVPAAADVIAEWDRLDVEQRRHVLRRSLSVVWVRKGRGPCAERVRVIEAGHTDFATDMSPVPWPDSDLVGEIRPLGTEDI